MQLSVFRLSPKNPARRMVWLVGILLLTLAALSACGPDAVATPEPPTPTRPLRPTFTPTSAEVALAEAATATAEVATPEPPTPEPSDTPAPEPTATPEAEPTPSDTPLPSPRFTVSNATANLRRGPGTNYDTAGQVSQGDFFDVLGKNQDGAWLEIDVAGQALWIAASLGSLENGELAPIAANIPPPPPPTRAPAPTQPPAAPAEPAPPPASDPCAGIGGDGCKFRVRGGPAFAANGGGELKLTLAFIHSGIDGGQAQGSYFLWLEKEGLGKLPVPDSNRSWTGDKRQGPNGAYNYEQKLALDVLGGNVAGCYFGWVLDGNGERDSQNFRFCVPDGQGEVWIEFDQA